MVLKVVDRLIWIEQVDALSNLRYPWLLSIHHVESSYDHEHKDRKLNSETANAAHCSPCRATALQVQQVGSTEAVMASNELEQSHFHFFVNSND